MWSLSVTDYLQINLADFWLIQFVLLQIIMAVKSSHFRSIDVFYSREFRTSLILIENVHPKATGSNHYYTFEDHFTA